MAKVAIQGAARLSMQRPIRSRQGFGHELTNDYPGDYILAESSHLKTTRPEICAADGYSDCANGVTYLQPLTAPAYFNQSPKASSQPLPLQQIPPQNILGR